MDYYIKHLGEMPLMLIGLLLLYFLPTILTAIRRPKEVFRFFIVNLLFGWTVVGYALLFVIGRREEEN